MPDLDNRRRGRDMRELAALVLRSRGVDSARPRVVQRRLSDRVSADRAPDVLGVPGWWIETRADLTPRFGPALDAARQAAAFAGVERAAVVQYRDGVPADEYTVTMTLAEFARLVRDLDLAEAIS